MPKMLLPLATRYGYLEHLQEFLKHSPNLKFLAKLRKTGVQQFLKSTPDLLALLKSESFAHKDTCSCARADPAATRGTVRTCRRAALLADSVEEEPLAEPQLPHHGHEHALRHLLGVLAAPGRTRAGASRAPTGA